MDVDKLKIDHPITWNLFFWFGGMVSLFIWNSILSLSNYWNVKFLDGMDAWYPFFYFGGSFANFFVFDPINRCMSFKAQLIIVPSYLLLAFFVIFLVAEFMEGDHLQTARVVIF